MPESWCDAICPNLVEGNWEGFQGPRSKVKVIGIPLTASKFKVFQHSRFN